MPQQERLNVLHPGEQPLAPAAGSGHQAKLAGQLKAVVEGV